MFVSFGCRFDDVANASSLVNVLINKIIRRHENVSQQHHYLLYHGWFTTKEQLKWDERKQFSISIHADGVARDFRE